MTKNLPEIIKTTRQERGWSQLELATRAGIDRKTVNRVENGKYAPTLDTLVSISSAFGVGIHELLA